MSDMIERVASAIRIANAGEYTSNAQATLMARAAIEAMRVPTAKMRSAIAAADWQCSSDLNWDDGFRIMIDAALEERE